MRCPKCGYTSFDQIAACVKCNHGLAETAATLNGTAYRVLAPLFLGASLAGAADAADDAYGQEAGGEEMVAFAAEPAADEGGVEFQFVEDEAAPAPEVAEAEEAEGVDVAVEPEAGQETAAEEDKSDEGFDFTLGLEEEEIQAGLDKEEPGLVLEVEAEVEAEEEAVVVETEADEEEAAFDLQFDEEPAGSRSEEDAAMAAAPEASPEQAGDDDAIELDFGDLDYADLVAAPEEKAAAGAGPGKKQPASAGDEEDLVLSLEEKPSAGKPSDAADDDLDFVLTLEDDD